MRGQKAKKFEYFEFMDGGNDDDAYQIQSPQLQSPQLINSKEFLKRNTLAINEKEFMKRNTLAINEKELPKKNTLVNQKEFIKRNTINYKEFMKRNTVAVNQKGIMKRNTLAIPTKLQLESIKEQESCPLNFPNLNSKYLKKRITFNQPDIQNENFKRISSTIKKGNTNLWEPPQPKYAETIRLPSVQSSMLSTPADSKELSTLEKNRNTTLSNINDYMWDFERKAKTDRVDLYKKFFQKNANHGFHKNVQSFHQQQEEYEELEHLFDEKEEMIKDLLFQTSNAVYMDQHELLKILNNIARSMIAETANKQFLQKASTANYIKDTLNSINSSALDQYNNNQFSESLLKGSKIVNDKLFMDKNQVIELLKFQEKEVKNFVTNLKFNPEGVEKEQMNPQEQYAKQLQNYYQQQQTNYYSNPQSLSNPYYQYYQQQILQQNQQQQSKRSENETALNSNLQQLQTQLNEINTELQMNLDSDESSDSGPVRKRKRNKKKKKKKKKKQKTQDEATDILEIE